MPTMWETRVQSLGREDLLKKEMATNSCILAWKPLGWWNLVGYSPRGCKESDTTERLPFIILRSYQQCIKSLVTLHLHPHLILLGLFICLQVTLMGME